MTKPDDTARPAAGDDYSATVLASHWVQRPEPDTEPDAEPDAEPDTVRATVRDDRDASAGTARQDRVAPDRVDPDRVDPDRADPDRADPDRVEPDRVEPDRVEGAVLRFGPGVQGATARRTHITLPVPAPPAPPGRRSRRRHALPVLVVLAVLAFLAWLGLGPDLTVHRVTVAARHGTVGCDGTAEITATLTTNGRPGTVSYRWLRSDGTASVLHQDVLPGQKQVRLRLLWTFEGKGRYEARAELNLLSPAGHTAATEFTYACP
ncbi:hypothetical protein GCM10009601_37810 [Streptomyces thermospinosisporus]|uniref:Ig-like domain-containing protein n=1 Tax=Streptomyces thermospinosisporus TaxID=161482 RepID=A0ABP4JSZ0_9ACTN